MAVISIRVLFSLCEVCCDDPRRSWMATGVVVSLPVSWLHSQTRAAKGQLITLLAHSFFESKVIQRNRFMFQCLLSKKVKLRRAHLALGLVTTLGGSVIPVFSRSLRPTQPGQPSVGRCNEYRRWCRPLLGKKQRVLCSSRPAARTASIVA